MCRVTPLLAILLFPTGAFASPSVRPVVMPSRGAEASWTQVATRIAESIAHRLSGKLAPAAWPLRLHDRLARARQQALSGALDAAANLLDSALEEGARAPERLFELGDFVDGHLRRISIALGRGEMAKARSLLSRLYRYDPRFTLEPVERSPQLEAALEEVRKSLGPDPQLEVGDLGEGCADEILIVVRRANRPPASGGGRGLELLRLDSCQLVARTQLDDSADVESAAAELARTPWARASLGRNLRAGRTQKIVGPILATLGAAAEIAGVYYAVLAGLRASNINQNCTTMAPCTGTELHKRSDAYQSAGIAGGLLVPVGAALLVSGAVFTTLGLRREKRSVAFSLVPGSAWISWRQDF